MNIEQTEKIRLFMRDEGMSNAVYQALLSYFLRHREIKDVQILAAERLSVDFLKEAWKTLEDYRDSVAGESKITTNVGL